MQTETEITTIKMLRDLEDENLKSTVLPTKCTQITHTEFIDTPHGRIRKEVTTTL
jgi:hypothetical protein